jgi:hypothetical protein
MVCGLELRNLTAKTSSDTPAGIWVRGTAHHIALCGNYVHNIVNSKNGGNAHGIAFYGTSSNAITDVLVEDNEVSNCVLGESEAVVLNGNVNGFVVKDNVVHDNDNIGIDFIGHEGVGPGGSDQARNGICVRNTVYNIDFANNVHYEGERFADGIYSDGGKDIVIEKNTVHHCNLGIEAGCEHNNKTTSNIIIRSNVVYNSHTGGIFVGGYDTTVGSAVNCQIVNNTLYNNNTDNAGWGGEIIMQDDCVGTIIKNNAIHTLPGRRVLNKENSTGSGNTLDYNVYYGQNIEWMYNNVLYSTFSAYKTGSSQDSHSLNTDPQYADTANFDFHIWTGSPCVNAGDPSLTYTGLQDIDGQARKYGANADIGADETLVP